MEWTTDWNGLLTEILEWTTEITTCNGYKQVVHHNL